MQFILLGFTESIENEFQLLPSSMIRNSNKFCSATKLIANFERESQNSERVIEKFKNEAKLAQISFFNRRNEITNRQRPPSSKIATKLLLFCFTSPLGLVIFELVHILNDFRSRHAELEYEKKKFLFKMMICDETIQTHQKLIILHQDSVKILQKSLAYFENGKKVLSAKKGESWSVGEITLLCGLFCVLALSALLNITINTVDSSIAKPLGCS